MKNMIDVNSTFNSTDENGTTIYGKENNFENRFYSVNCTISDIISQLSYLTVVSLFVLFQDFRIIKIIFKRISLQTPSNILVVQLLLWDSIMLMIFFVKIVSVFTNGGIMLNDIGCKSLYFFQRLFRGFQISSYTLISLEKALFIIFPFKYEVIFLTKIPTITILGIYSLTSILSLSCFFEPVRFLPGPLSCSNSVFAKNNAVLTLGVVIRGLFFIVCLVCFVTIAVFAAYFNRKERKFIKHASKSVHRELFYGMLRNIAITTILTIGWTLQWALIGLMNDSKSKFIQGRTAAILYHTLVAIINPIMIRLFYKSIKMALKEEKSVLPGEFLNEQKY